MTMHLVRGITSLNTRKRKTTNLDMDQMAADFRAYNKDLRRRGLAFMQFATLESYVDYRLGRGVTKKSATRDSKTVSSTVLKTSPKPFVRETERIPSLNAAGPGFAAKKDPNKYSGDYLVGIATMHKSNLVAVGRDDSPESYSTMRRG